MSTGDLEYNIVCPICSVETSVIVFEVDEKPVFCSMCGEEADVQQV